MTNKVVEYNIMDVDFIVGTTPITDITGDVTVVKNEDDVTTGSDLAGNGWYNINNNGFYTITMPVNPSSYQASFLKGLWASGKLFPFFIKSKVTNEVVSFISCKFQKAADKTFGAEIGDRPWIFYAYKAIDII